MEIFRGLIFEVYDPDEEHPGLGKFILAETFEKGYVFQVINISGYNAGFVEGLIHEMEPNKRYVTMEFLMKELETQVFGSFDRSTFKVISK